MTQQEQGEDLGHKLCKLARAAIAESLGGAAVKRPTGAAFEKLGAVFVTLYRGAVLHGCIGSLEAHRKLADDVIDNAVAAALRDPRAVPLRLADVAKLTVEVSLLSPLERVFCSDEESAIAALRPHVDGVLLRYRQNQGTFLPQVWESLPEPHQFLAELRLKARLPADFWAPDLALFRYHVDKYIDKPHA